MVNNKNVKFYVTLQSYSIFNPGLIKSRYQCKLPINFLICYHFISSCGITYSLATSLGQP